MAGYASKVRAIGETIELSTRKDDGTPYSAYIGLLGKEDEDYVRAALLGGRKTKGQYVQEDGGKGKTTLDQVMDDSSYTDALLARGIKSWDLDGEDGKVLPISEQTVRILSGPDSKKLIKAIKDLNEPASKADKSGS